jgi:hypothetical protein
MLKRFALAAIFFITGAVSFAPVFTVGQSAPPISFVQLISSDEVNIVEPIFLAGRWRLPVDANISSVNVPNGRDPIPDAYFTVLNTGLENDTIKIDVIGTAADPSIPDDDVPTCTKTFTTQASEVGDEAALAQRIINEIRADLTWRNTCFLRAQKVKDRKIVHVFSSKFSLVGEFYARPNAGDFNITTTGSADVFEPHNTLVSRTKETSLAQDPDNPHTLGILGISGSVQVSAGAIADIFQQNALNGGSADLRVDGSVTPVDFTIDCDTEDDIFIEELRFHANCNGLKRSTFLCLNQALSNGVYLEIRSDEQTTAWPAFRSTSDFADLFARGTGQNWIYEDVAGTDGIRATLTLNNPFPIRVCGTYTTDDYVLVRVQDDIDSGLVEFAFTGFGFTKEP